MSERRRLSNAIKCAVRSAALNERAQDELHNAFEAVYGFSLDIEELGGDDLVETLVYGHGPHPSLSDFDAYVNDMENK